jgi:hypothetical protein
MRPVLTVFAGLSAIFLSSCAMYGDAVISGRQRDVSEADIRAAIAADRATPRAIPGQQLREIEVASPDEIHLFWEFSKREHPGYNVVKRIHGKWQFEGTVVAYHNKV